MKRRARGVLFLLTAAAVLWTASAAAPAGSAAEAAESLGLALLRYERGDFPRLGGMSLPAALALSQTPLLLAAPLAEAPAEEEPPRETPPEAENAPPSAERQSAAESGAERAEDAPEPPPVSSRDNGVPAVTLRPADPSDYVIRGGVFVNHASDAALRAEDLEGAFALLPEGEGPKVLILHTHGCEAYTMPEGEEYEQTDDHRTLDESRNVLRVGDEIARVLEERGIATLHDRTLYDYPSYSGAYNRSLDTAERLREEYPSLLYVLDVHRDAIADAAGKQFKVVSAEEPDTAQLEFVIGSDGGGLEHPRWRENLRLAAAVQETLLSAHPTLLRPIVVRNSRYNQQLSPGALLLEVGAAGNSLSEALNAARLFAEGFADTVTR